MSLSRIPLYLMAALSLAIALASWRFVFLDPLQAYPGLEAQIINRRTLFMLHIAASPVALAVGALQFFPRLRARRGLHRWLGRTYGATILIGGISGLVIALHAQGGLTSTIGFGLLALLWMGFTAKAILHAIRGEYAAHRRWMMRSFALTFAGVTLRLYLGVGAIWGYDYAALAPLLAWICWVPNLAIVQMWIRQKGA